MYRTCEPGNLGKSQDELVSARSQAEVKRSRPCNTWIRSLYENDPLTMLDSLRGDLGMMIHGAVKENK